MGISQHDRDRLEDLGLVSDDNTEDLCPRNAKTPEATGASPKPNHPTHKLKGSSRS
ncbi:Uncharacterised protein [Mycobacteroides abscessus subsp. bolletii]|nr:Uncharacterised protein [Mycobacteroides abscessus subsp. bolletii]SLD55301.1 Uncharacterised protein [Mycobacteroides abscessus subsp. bolletii]SLE99239.1 Uncharacterised protein [Mycobacteroides abscessus subsp. bolletii]